MKSLQNVCCFLLVLVSCKPEIPDNCEGEYYFKRPYTTSHPKGVVNLNELMTLEVKFPFNDYNYRSDSLVNISRFNKVIGGITISEVFKDSSSITGITDKGVDNAFSFNSVNVKLDFTPGTGGRNRVRYNLAKKDSIFIATIQIRPLRKGVFLIGLYNGFIEDAFCNAGINFYWGNFSPVEAIDNLESFMNIQLPFEIRQLQLNERQAFYVKVE
jgi:hypothetical protein